MLIFLIRVSNSCSKFELQTEKLNAADEINNIYVFQMRFL